VPPNGGISRWQAERSEAKPVGCMLCWAAARCGFTRATNLCFGICHALQEFQVALSKLCLACVKRLWLPLDQITPACVDTCAHPQPRAVNQPLQDTERRVEPTI